MRLVRSIPIHYYLISIIIIGLIVRTLLWNYFNYGGPEGELIRGYEEFFFLARQIASADWEKYFSAWRSIQPMYPLYLAPMYYFQIHEFLYVFTLHTFFLSGTIIFLYHSTRLLFGRKIGLISVFIYALHLQVAHWFYFTLADIAFHFHLALTLWIFLISWRNCRWINFICTLFSGLALALTRTEGLFVLGIVIVLIVYKKLSEIVKPVYAFFIQIAILIISLSIFLIIMYNNPMFHNKVLSHEYMARGLYNLSMPTPKTTFEVEEHFFAQNKLTHREKSDFGIKRIKENPWRTVGIFLKRYVEVIYPSHFMMGVSWRYIAFDFLITIFLTGGTLAAVVFSKERRPEIIALILVAFTIYTIVTIYQREWDLRVQLSAHVCLLIIAPYGLYTLAKRFKKNRYYPLKVIKSYLL